MASIVPKWSQAMKRHPRKRATAKMRLEEVEGASDTHAELIGDPAFWADILDEYWRSDLMWEMKKEWRARAYGNDEVLPNLVPSSHKERRSEGKGFDPRIFQAAFTDLESRILKKGTLVERSEAVLTMGPMKEVLAPEMNLTRYMPTQSTGSSKSKLTTLWYAVEFGTGALAGHDAYEGVRTNKYIRLEGDTKDPAGDGTWWLGQKAGQGAHFKGQSGLHFLHEARTREPKEKWFAFISRTLPLFIQKHLKAEFGGAYRAAQ